MWANKPSASASNAGDPPQPDTVVEFQGSRRESPRRGLAGGLRIVGEIKGREDLYIAGEVSGSVYLPGCAIHVGPDADVTANMTARAVEIEGRVTGDLAASERITIRRSGTVTGDIVSPQVQIEEGCRFKGCVQMREPDVKPKVPDGQRPAAEAAAMRGKAANE